jgi:Cu(I)/Ag(I) efflux system membrane protein CusA/SilA
VIARVIEFCVRNRALVILAAVAVSLAGIWCLSRTPIDAIPDLSENQVIVWADWPGRSPKEMEEQVTYPLSANLQGLAGVKSVRAVSEFGFSMINVIFDDGVDFYFARQRILERLSGAAGVLPAGVIPYMAPDATALGQIFWYTVEGEGKSLDELRAIQDWTVRYPLNAVPGVAEVAGVGGFVREYQVDVDPGKLRAYDVSLGQVFAAVTASNSSVGGKVIHKGGSEYLVRGMGWIRDAEDLRSVVVAEREGVPITVDRLGTVQLGPGFRRSVLEKNGREAVGGVVMMRYGENPLAVTERIKARIQELQPSLPEGVRIVPFYDRTGLIHASIDTLKGILIEAILVASIVVFLILWHVRSAFVICVTLPLAVLISFIFMYLLKIPSNIMSLCGIAISIGVLVDAGIVMTENAYHRLHDKFGGARVTGDTRPIVIEACKLVGGPLFFSILIMLLSFAPVFVLGGREGKMFNPLAYTKSFALVGVAVLAVTLVPALIPTFIRGRLRSQEDVWLVRSFAEVYRPLLDFFLRNPAVIVLITGALLILSLPLFPRAYGVVPKVPYNFFVILVPFFVLGSVVFLVRRWWPCVAALAVVALAAYLMLTPLGEEFMPPLNELAIMDMPSSRPNINITQAGEDMRRRDALMRRFPEVHQVVGKAGRAETATDPAPVEMIETVVSLRPQAWWPRRAMRYDDVRAEAAAAAQALESEGILKPAAPEARASLVDAAAMEAAQGFDRRMRELSMQRLEEFMPVKGLQLARRLRSRIVEALGRHGRLIGTALPEGAWAALDEELAGRYARRFDEWVLAEDVAEATQRIVRFLIEQSRVEDRPDLLVEPETVVTTLTDPLWALIGAQRPTLVERWRRELEELQDELMRRRVRELDDELRRRGPGMMEALIVEALAQTDGRSVGESDAARLEAIRDRRVGPFASSVLLWVKTLDEVRSEMDAELQVPGWGNTWTRPIQNRVDMMATGVRTAVGVKIFGQGPTMEETLKQLERISQAVAGVLKPIRGARDIIADPIRDENYLEIEIDRAQAARYGVSVEEIQNVIEVALGGKEITATVEGRRRFPVRVRYPRDWREDEERVRDILVAAGAPAMPEANGGGGEPRRVRHVPLSRVAQVRIVPGPSMIKSEDGRLRSYVQLNVRGRDMVGFVEEAKRAVEAKVKLPPGYSIQWSGQFEHQVSAQRTLMLVLPAVGLIIFVILYLTYRDFADTLIMFLAVPGAAAGGALAQAIFGVDFSVAVWVGFIACFGLATETAIVMLVYLREAIDRRGGMEKIRDEAELKAAVMEGAVQRLRPKLLTEGTTILALIPMLWATGVGSEFIAPMAVPILGGILVADEVIDILIPVLFYKVRCRRLRAREVPAAVAP